MKRHASRFAAVIVALFAALGASGGDWPQYRYDAGRTAASPHGLPADLSLLWVRDLPAPRPAVPQERRLCFDASYEPVVLGKTLFVPSMVTDSVTALDTETGRLRWRFFAEGPVRLAPAARRDKVYFVSDDGFLYCVGAADGRLKWRFRGLPAGRADRKLMGNGRLVSLFPAWGGPVLADGIVYFAAGIFSDEGVFVHALDAETGRVAWSNTDSDRIEQANPDHGVAGVAGISPQGHLAIVHDTLVVPCGAQLPALLDPKSGERHTYTMGWGGRYRLPKGSAFVSGTGAYLMHAGDLYDMGQPGMAPPAEPAYRMERMIHLAGLRRLQVEPTNEKALGDFREPVLTPDAMYYQQDGIVAYDMTRPEMRRRGKTKAPERRRNGEGGRKETEKYPDPASIVFPERWRLPVDSTVHIKAGGRLYCGKPGAVEALDIPGDGETPGIGWRTEVEGTPHRMLAADGKLFVVTREGRLYAFGPDGPARPVVHGVPAAGPAPADRWTTRTSALFEATGITEGYILVPGLSDPRLAKELVRQSDCDVIVVEADHAKAAGLRERFQQSGLYGTRISVLIGDPASYPLPPYLADLIVPGSPDTAARADDPAFVKGLFRCLRPYGGTLCLEVPAPGQPSWAGSVSGGAFEGGVFRRQGGLALLIREGPLHDTADWSHAGANAANTGASQDRLVKAPLSRLWFHGAFRWHRQPNRAEVRVAGGRIVVQSDDLVAVDAYTGRRLWRTALRSAPGKLVALEDAVYAVAGKSCVVLDPATGQRTGEMTFPGGARGYWSSIRAADEMLVAASDDRLAAIDRKTGRALWEHRCEKPVASIAVGGGRVFWAERVNRRGPVYLPEASEGATRAVDALSGDVLWEIDDAGEILYGEALDVVVIGAELAKSKESHPRFNSGYPLRQFTAYRAADGHPLWKGIEGTHGFIVGDKLIVYLTQDTPKHAFVTVYDLLTGRELSDEMEWYQRGCTVLRAGANLLTTRYRANAAYYDLAAGEMIPISNVRAACSNNLFPADGVLSMPNLIDGCTCNYMPVSQAFAPSSAFE